MNRDCKAKKSPENGSLQEKMTHISGKKLYHYVLSFVQASVSLMAFSCILALRSIMKIKLSSHTYTWAHGSMPLRNWEKNTNTYD